MSSNEMLVLVLRWAHLLAAITAAGGAIFARYALLPVLETLPEEQRRQLHDAIRGRWAKFVHLSIAVLLLTGLYNFMVVIGPKNVPREYHIVFGLKFLLAMFLFFVASVLMGRGHLAQTFRRNARTWLLVNVALAVTIVCLSGVLRWMNPRSRTVILPAVVAPAAVEKPAAEPATK